MAGLSRHRSRRGFTLVEVAIAVLLLGLLSGSVLQLLVRGTGAYSTGIAITDVETRNARVLERMLRELSLAAAGSLNPPDPAGGDWVEFVAPADVNGTVVEWGPVVRFAFEPEPGEPNNGVDDDGDGLVDEGVLVRIQDPGGPEEQRAVLVHGVAELLEGELPNAVDDNGNGLADEGGFAVTVQNGSAFDAVALRLTLQAIGPSGELYERTLDTTVALRN